MSWDAVIGQHRVKDLLRRALANGTMAHAYLFVGAEGIGKDALAFAFARALLCERGGADPCGTCSSCVKMETMQHPNLRFVCALPTGANEKAGDDPILALKDDQVEEVREHLQRKARDPYYRLEIPKANFIKINSVRDIRRQSSLATFEGGNRIFVISEADRMNAEAANSLLKTLEEPLPDTYILLTTSNRDQLLPTILSRCQTVQCDLLTESEIKQALMEKDGAAESDAAVAASLANGSYIDAQRLLTSDVAKAAGEIVAFLRAALSRNAGGTLDQIESLLAEYDKPALERWLVQLQGWLRTAMLRAEGAAATYAGDASFDSFVAKFGRGDLGGSIGAVDTAIAHLHKNIYLPLVMMNLALELRSNLQRTGHA